MTVIRMHNHRDTGEPGGHPSHSAGLRRMGMDDVGALWLVHALRDSRAEMSKLHREILDRLGHGLKVPKEAERFDPLAGVVRVGESAAEAGVHFRDGVALLSFNRPEQRNGWTHDLGQCYFDQLDRAERDEQARAIVVTGVGKSFCPGLDQEVLGATAGAGAGIARPTKPRSFTHAITVNKPIVAAINGGCAGMGFVQAAMCDVRFASQSARFSTSFARRGVAAEHGITHLLTRQVGLQRALDLLLSGRTFGAAEAQAYGFVLEVFEDEDLLPRVIEYAAELATWSSPAAMGAIKRQVYDDLDRDLDSSREQAVDLMVSLSRGPDFAEGVASYLERRKPIFPALSPQNQCGILWLSRSTVFLSKRNPNNSR